MRRVLQFVVALGLGVACSAPTGLTRTTFAVDVAGVDRDATQPLVVRTPSGWSVRVTAAEVSIAAVYLWDGAPAVGTVEAPGRTVAEVIGVGTINALDPTLRRLAVSGLGVTDPARSGELLFTEAATGPIADLAGPNVAVAHIAGIATRGTSTVSFDGWLEVLLRDASSDYQWYVSRRLTQVPVDNIVVGSTGVLSLRVDPSHWLDSVDFSAIEAPPNSFDDRANRARLIGSIRSRDAFVFSWRVPAP